MKEKRPLSLVKEDLESAPPTRDFIGALKASNLQTEFPGLIAEVKKASPSRGVLREDFDSVEVARAYEKGGAACLSVLTDEKYFQGSLENLEAIRSARVKCPLLCKEFVIDAWQIYYARTKGADTVLLIVGVLPDLDIRYMTKICKMLGLAALVEVHNEREMDRVLGIDGIELIGNNNRDLMLTWTPLHWELKHLRLILVTQRSFLKESVDRRSVKRTLLWLGSLGSLLLLILLMCKKGSHAALWIFPYSFAAIKWSSMTKVGF